MTNCTDGHEWTPIDTNFGEIEEAEWFVCENCPAILTREQTRAMLNEHAKLKRKIERLQKHSQASRELAGRLYWFAPEGNRVYEMDDGGAVIIERPALLANTQESE